MKSVYDAIKFVVSLVPAVRTASADGTGVDTLGYTSAVAIIQAGDIDLTTGDETYSFKVQDSADNSSFADVASLSATTVTADDQTKLIRVEGLGTSVRRYIRVVATLAGTTPSCPVSAVIGLGNGYNKPAN